MASNFAGVPLAFAFIATLGRTGFVTALIKNLFGVNIYTQTEFDLYSFWGLSLTYMYFQFPLMVLIMAPALDGLKREWREAAEILGASAAQYWLRVALPVLLPSILGSMILLFGNAFGAYATAYASQGQVGHYHHSDWGADKRRCSSQPRAWICYGDGNGCCHGNIPGGIFMAST